MNRKIARIKIIISYYEREARKTRSDLKRHHFKLMANQYREMLAISSP